MIERRVRRTRLLFWVPGPLTFCLRLRHGYWLQ